MNPILGWALAALALVAGWFSYGWPGLVLAVTVITFWLLLQFNRVLRVMANAGHAPVGTVKSAVMLNAKLRDGMTMIQIVQLTRSLGQKVDEAGEVWSWRDGGHVTVTTTLKAGRLTEWRLTRPPESPEEAPIQAPVEALASADEPAPEPPVSTPAPNAHT